MLSPLKIKSRRDKLKLTLAEAATAIGWGPGGRGHWHDLESGKRNNLTSDTIKAIAKALGCKVKDLLDESA
jgi:transcriptional regulator with XRE-family HTH domain